MKVTVCQGELQKHQEILTRLQTALRDRNFSLTVIFPTLSLLKCLQNEFLNLPEIAGSGGVRFLLFEGFIQEVRNRFGFKSRLPDLLERHLLLSKAFQSLLEEKKLEYLNKIPFKSKYRQAILDGFSEWKRSGLAPEILEEWAADQTGKARELALLYRSYQRLLVENGFTDDDLTLADLQWLGLQGGSLREEPVPVILYGFMDLTPLQDDYIKALNPWFVFEALVDPTGVVEFQDFVAEHFAVKLKKDETAPFLENGNKLTLLRERFWIQEAPAVPAKATDESLNLIQTAGTGRESVAIAREISRLLRSDANLSPDDFLILTTAPASFCKAAQPIFNEYQLYLSDYPVILKELPIINQFLRVLQVCLDGWDWREMKVFIRQCYEKDGFSVADQLILILGNLFGALSTVTGWKKALASKCLNEQAVRDGIPLEPLRLACQWLESIPQTANLQDYLQLTEGWLKKKAFFGPELFKGRSCFFQSKLINYRAALRMIEALDLLLDAPADLLELNKQLSLEEFKAFIEDYLLEQEVVNFTVTAAKIRVIPPREARGLCAKVVFITDLEEGNFPRIYINDWKLGPVERRELNALGINLENGEQYQLQEKIAFYWAIQTARERLYLVYQEQDGNGHPLNKSKFLTEIIAFFPGLAEQTRRYQLEPEVCRDYQSCFSEYERRELWVERLLTPINDLDPGERHWSDGRLQISLYRNLAYQVFEWFNHYREHKTVFTDPAILTRLDFKFGKTQIISITAIEEFRACPYRFYLKEVLKIKPMVEPQLIPGLRELGLLYHQVLGKFCSTLTEAGFNGFDYKTNWLVLEDIFTAIFRNWRDSVGNAPSRAVLSFQEEEIKRNLQRWLRAEIQWGEATHFRFHPGLLEFGFGLNPESAATNQMVPAYRFKSDQVEANLAGRIDRIDFDFDHNYLVYDYKLGKGPTAGDLRKLKKIQIPLYLLALEELFRGRGRASGGCYLSMGRPSRVNGGLWRQSLFGINHQGKNFLEETQWDEWLNQCRRELADTIRAVRNGNFGFPEGACLPYCEYRDCCLSEERAREREKTDDDAE